MSRWRTERRRALKHTARELRMAVRYVDTWAKHAVGTAVEWQLVAERVLPGAIEREHQALLAAREVWKRWPGKPRSSGGA